MTFPACQELLTRLGAAAAATPGTDKAQYALGQVPPAKPVACPLSPSKGPGSQRLKAQYDRSFRRRPDHLGFTSLFGCDRFSFNTNFTTAPHGQNCASSLA
jgi:hypothetical protein